MVTKAEKCRGSVGLYKAKGGGVCDFSFSNTGDQSEKTLNLKAASSTLAVGSKMICLGCNKDLCSWRSKYKSFGALRGCDLGVRDCLQVYCGK